MAVSDQHRVTQIVLFRYHSSVPWTELEHHFADLTKLKSTCVKPAATGKPYILSMSMGKNHSWENFAKGMTHCIVLEFANVEDRDFYLLEDPVHRAFSVDAAPLIEDSVVVDFVNGSLLGPGHGPESKSDNYRSYRGACQCGLIDFYMRSPSGKPPTHVICHCDTCKKISGAPYTCNYIISSEDLVISQGRERLRVYEYQGASGKNVSCYYCEKCTSHIYHVQERDPSKAIVRTLLLDCGHALGASGEIFSEGALGWARDLRAALPA
ncbi:uncharacterized protein Z519_01670 [Cladophialophora bantiana CBS 173.52]|uniref:CENP-V/GFA domain-containing protein n=1 Tax=Cladophialophora bantiana (strain ATCC 10958 / CBS 173.52 / CDC B-1940 / NIH 8579) TaxID=1442370 RepID=A0A0D2F7M5_CLAB1|nr:uncharacterized protein Z519_01670 [Cladophialophora bantiana CBS 173.52]KIW98086.1 hypothetical protein Z519_01670 [Cladophialophora bantiana CBS 173.52]